MLHQFNFCIIYYVLFVIVSNITRFYTHVIYLIYHYNILFYDFFILYIYIFIFAILSQ